MSKFKVGDYIETIGDDVVNGNRGLVVRVVPNCTIVQIYEVKMLGEKYTDFFAASDMKVVTPDFTPSIFSYNMLKHMIKTNTLPKI